MKILELCPYSAGICGVFARVREESIRLSELGHEVVIFSSNFEKGTGKRVKDTDSIGKIKIRRFKALKLGGESFMFWDFINEAVNFSPDVIIAHNYRHLHTTRALKLARILRKQGKKVKVLLVTHAPFVEGDITRSFVEKIVVKIYDSLVGRFTINKFDKILAISNWEIPCLLKMGAKRNKITYVPNGIPELFFQQKKVREENKILFLGRIAPKKKIETLISAIPYIKDKKIKIEIVGPREKEYYNSVTNLIDQLNLKERVFFSDAIYKIPEKIRKIDSASIFVLPSRVEGMPQSLIEAMARKKVVIGSDSIAIRDLISDGKNGFLFEFDNSEDLAAKINYTLSKNNAQIKENAYKSVKQFNWDIIIKKINNLIK